MCVCERETERERERLEVGGWLTGEKGERTILVGFWGGEKIGKGSIYPAGEGG